MISLNALNPAFCFYFLLKNELNNVKFDCKAIKRLVKEITKNVKSNIKKLRTQMLKYNLSFVF